MGRAKQRMELISKAKSRYVTFQKRKKGLKKKTYELQTLCDVEVCLIIYAPATDERANPSEAEIWPENPEKIHRLIETYKNQPSEDSLRRTQNVSSFFIDRNQKIEDSLVKLRKKNDEADYPTWDDRYTNLSKEQLREFEVILERKLQDVKARIALMKDRSHTQIPSSASVQDMFGMRNVKLEEVHELQPIAMLNPRHEFDFPIHCPFGHEIQQGIQIDANRMGNPVMMMPMNYGIQFGGASSGKFMCNLPVVERPIYGFEPSLMSFENTMCNSIPLPAVYSNPNVETMSMWPYLPYFKMGNDSSHMGKYYKASEFETRKDN